MPEMESWLPLALYKTRNGKYVRIEVGEGNVYIHGYVINDPNNIMEKEVRGTMKRWLCNGNYDGPDDGLDLVELLPSDGIEREKKYKYA